MLTKDFSNGESKNGDRSSIAVVNQKQKKNSDITPLDGIKITRIRDKHQMAVYYLCKHIKKKKRATIFIHRVSLALP